MTLENKEPNIPRYSNYADVPDDWSYPVDRENYINATPEDHSTTNAVTHGFGGSLLGAVAGAGVAKLVSNPNLGSAAGIGALAGGLGFGANAYHKAKKDYKFRVLNPDKHKALQEADFSTSVLPNKQHTENRYIDTHLRNVKRTDEDVINSMNNICPVYDPNSVVDQDAIRRRAEEYSEFTKNIAKVRAHDDLRKNISSLSEAELSGYKKGLRKGFRELNEKDRDKELKSVVKGFPPSLKVASIFDPSTKESFDNFCVNKGSKEEQLLTMQHLISNHPKKYLRLSPERVNNIIHSKGPDWDSGYDAGILTDDVVSSGLYHHYPKEYEKRFGQKKVAGLSKIALPLPNAAVKAVTRFAAPAMGAAAGYVAGGQVSDNPEDQGTNRLMGAAVGAIGGRAFRGTINRKVVNPVIRGTSRAANTAQGAYNGAVNGAKAGYNGTTQAAQTVAPQAAQTVAPQAAQAAAQATPVPQAKMSSTVHQQPAPVNPYVNQQRQSAQANVPRYVPQQPNGGTRTVVRSNAPQGNYQATPGATPKQAQSQGFVQGVTSSSPKYTSNPPQTSQTSVAPTNIAQQNPVQQNAVQQNNVRQNMSQQKNNTANSI